LGCRRGGYFLGGNIVAKDSSNSADTERILMMIRSGDRNAFDELFERHREQLQRAIDLQLTPELKARFDASDVIQEAHLEAYRRLEDYLAREPMPFGIWIRKTVQQRFQKLKRSHLHTKLRSVNREQALPEESSMAFFQVQMSALASPDRELPIRCTPARLLLIVQVSAGDRRTSFSRAYRVDEGA
jgi:DNA-directed RNA polymerase specialized sigma24 family protein